jgi:hypothetical protein
VDESDMIKEPVPYNKVQSQCVSLSSDGSEGRNYIDVTTTHRKAMARHNEQLNDGNYDDGRAKQDDYVYCEGCNNKPFCWTDCGPGIICYINNDFVGCFVGPDGKIVDEEKIFVQL